MDGFRFQTGLHSWPGLERDAPEIQATAIVGRGAPVEASYGDCRRRDGIPVQAVRLRAVRRPGGRDRPIGLPGRAAMGARLIRSCGVALGGLANAKPLLGVLVLRGAGAESVSPSVTAIGIPSESRTCG